MLLTLLKKKILYIRGVEDENVITAIGMFFREFAEAVLRKFGYDIGDKFMRDAPDEYRGRIDFLLV